MRRGRSRGVRETLSERVATRGRFHSEPSHPASAASSRCAASMRRRPRSDRRRQVDPSIGARLGREVAVSIRGEHVRQQRGLRGAHGAAIVARRAERERVEQRRAGVRLCVATAHGQWPALAQRNATVTRSLLRDQILTCHVIPEHLAQREVAVEPPRAPRKRGRGGRSGERLELESACARDEWVVVGSRLDDGGACPRAPGDDDRGMISSRSLIGRSPGRAHASAAARRGRAGASPRECARPRAAA